jgi:serine/threonine-protein kinase
MLAGEAPFSGKGHGESAHQSVEEPPPPLSSFRTDLPPDLEAVILTAMAKNPEMRYQTMRELVQQLERVVGSTGSVPTEQPATNNNLWKTAFIVLAGIAILSAALIYATSVKQTDPKTQLQPDANGQPVQPINPATGAQEQALANMAGMSSEVLGNSNMAVPPGTLPGGDGYDPWKNGGQPPPGAPNVGPGGQVITIDPNNPSQFMPNEGGVILVPVPANNAVKPTPTPKNAANTSVQPSPSPKTTPEAKPTPATEKTPTKPATQKTPAPTTKPSPKKPGDIE